MTARPGPANPSREIPRLHAQAMSNRPRRGEILANWERARRNEPLLGIDPLA
jgi:hypothetical protein